MQLSEHMFTIIVIYDLHYDCVGVPNDCWRRNVDDVYSETLYILNNIVLKNRDNSSRSHRPNCYFSSIWR